eukprot:TRINITY_DN3827_c0_g1_i4.p1 TRINITY_DN3827_c0_g1~~TRINITY_DN3827_c0_g1_i4.p1  ORF type:complete len:429 (-),score=47.11 TRINITY_DN3827_c0_g1_i4:80-1366(-)
MSSTPRRFASRMDNLGTETAYAVSSEAAALKAKGVKIYPFHIGDLNFPTPQHIIDAAKKAMDDGKTGYCPAAGLPELREVIATEISNTRGVLYSSDNVSVQPGGKTTIGKFLMCVMEEGAEVLYPSPGYPIYESQINFLGGKAVPYQYVETASGYGLNLPALRSSITENTKVLIYNNYQNPTGTAATASEMQEIARIAVEHDLWVLADEAYYDLVYDGVPQSIVSLPGMQERSMILFTFSKSFCMTGWRLAASIGPKDMITLINKLNTNYEACTTHFVQCAGIAALTPQGKAHIKPMMDELRLRRDALINGLRQIPGFHPHVPQAAFYVFVNVTEAMKMLGLTDLERFRHLILQTGVSFCTREHFGARLDCEDDYYIRFAFSGITVDQINEAMGILKKFVVARTQERVEFQESKHVTDVVPRSEKVEA